MFKSIIDNHLLPPLSVIINCGIRGPSSCVRRNKTDSTRRCRGRTAAFLECSWSWRWWPADESMVARRIGRKRPWDYWVGRQGFLVWRKVLWWPVDYIRAVSRTGCKRSWVFREEVDSLGLDHSSLMGRRCPVPACMSGDEGRLHY
jgi:hypothetical protein